MNELKEALGDICLTNASAPMIERLAPIIEKALDATIDKILDQGIPEDVRAAWHAVFVAAMTEGS